jgi:hypothetical protein
MKTPMPARLMLSCIGLCLLGLSYESLEAQTEIEDKSKTVWDFSGHAKYRLNYLTYPDNSAFYEVLGSNSLDNILEVRLKFSAYHDRWDFKTDYQFIAVHGDTLELGRFIPGAAPNLGNVINDDRRWWNLTHTITNEGNQLLVQRLDRLSIAYSGEHIVWRFGRQAISWGNGMIFTPMDIFNPFDPATVDREYKTGDDMLYGQYLFNNGNDMQAVAVVRRNLSNGNVESDQSSLAVKYHGFFGMNEYDILLAEHYGDRIIGLGGIYNLGGAVGRGDLTWTDTGEDSVFSLATSISYSWTWGGKNISGLLEYYHNGFGQNNGAYSPGDLVKNQELLKRVARGEIFTLARNYLAASATIEVNPLLRLIPNLFINMEDPSTLAQLVAQYDWKQNLQILTAVNIPIGPDGSEYGGIDAPAENLYFSTGAGFFAQLAWYY